MTIVENFKFGIPFAELPRYQADKPVGTKPVERKSKIDYALLDEILQFIEDHPRTWKQGAWFQTLDTETGVEKYVVKIETVEELNSCGSSFCLAGHVAIRTGFPAPPLKNTQEWERKVDGKDYPEPVSTFAANQLGINANQAEALFEGNNTLKDLKRMAILLKINPEVSFYDLEDVRNIDDYDDEDDEFLEIIRRHLP